LGELETVDAQVEEAIKEEKPPGNKGERVYSDTARCFFAKIKALRDRGFSFVQICKAYEKIGQLPKYSNPYSFRQAFLRELGRRNQSGELLREVKEGGHETENETPPQIPAMSVMETGKDNMVEAGIDDELTEKKKIAALTSSTMKTGLGKLTKHSDGSFDFDWK
jgi:DNA-binding transcriptional MerR regulator